MYRAETEKCMIVMRKFLVLFEKAKNFLVVSLDM